MMRKPLLGIDNLSVRYNTRGEHSEILDRVSIEVEEGGSLGIIGETGSGKTTLAMAVMRLLDKKADIAGEINFRGKNLLSVTSKEIEAIRWSKISVMFQNGLDVMNPVLTILEQLSECIVRHCGASKKDAEKKSYELLDSVGLDRGTALLYPHQVSGGMRQRALFAMAISCDPEILIADEPTSSLDSSLKVEIIGLLSELQKKNKFTLIVISHEISTIYELTSRLAVMYRGRVVEEGVTREVLINPMHPYTRGLINSSPDINPYRDLWGIPQNRIEQKNAGCVFYSRCTQRESECRDKKPELEYAAIERKVACNRGGIVPILQGRSLNYAYQSSGMSIKACEDCSINVYSGEVTALIGESGSGKSTLAALLAGVFSPDSGTVEFNGNQVTGNSETSKNGGLQIIFQDPYTSINENFTVMDAVSEPLVISKKFKSDEIINTVVSTLNEVDLPSEQVFLERRCHTLSGGERQRIAIARALVMRPSLLIADEITSMLDTSTRANIIRMLKGLQNTKGFAMLFITHDLAVAGKISDRVYLMKQGKIAEKGSVHQVLHRIDSEREYTGSFFYNNLKS